MDITLISTTYFQAKGMLVLLTILRNAFICTIKSVNGEKGEKAEFE